MFTKHNITVATATIALAGALLLPFGATAQTTDEARIATSKSTAQNAWVHAFERPALEDANSAGTEAEWRNVARIATYYGFHQSLRDYEAGVRSTPIAVDSTDGAKQEAARIRREQELASYVAYLQNSPAARLAHQVALSEATVATK